MSNLEDAGILPTAKTAPKFVVDLDEGGRPIQSIIHFTTIHFINSLQQVMSGHYKIPVQKAK